MFEPQHFLDLQENGALGDPKSWLSGDGHSSPVHSRTHSSLSTAAAAPAASAGGAAGNVDRVLFNDLVEMVPLVQSLIDRKANSSFTRRGSMIYTKTPSRESYSKRISDLKGKNAAQSIPTKKRTDHGDKDHGKNVGNHEGGADSLSMFSSRALSSEKDKEELNSLREQLEDLQRKLIEKDKLLKSLEITKGEMIATQEKLDELKQQAAQKDSLLKSTQLQLSDAKIKLADRQAALEKVQWEAQSSNRKLEMLQENLNSTQGEISFLMMLFEGLTNNDSNAYSEDLDTMPYHVDYLPEIDDLDEVEMQKMEEARKAYVAAVAVAKEKQDDESIAVAASARSHLQSFVYRPKSARSMWENPKIGIS